MTAAADTAKSGIAGWIDRNILELGREMRVSYLPPLMVYMAAGVSGLTAIVGTFFVKDYLGTVGRLPGRPRLLGRRAVVPEDAARPFGRSDLALEGGAGLSSAPG